MTSRPLVFRAVVALSVLLVLVLAAPAAGDEGFGIESFTSQVETGSVPVRQAGAHPERMITTIMFKHHKSSSAQLGIAPNGNPRSLEVSFPPGLLVNPTATTERCTEEELLTNGRHLGQLECPPGAAVGEALAFLEVGNEAAHATIYNMVPPPGVAADFAFNVIGQVIVHIVGKVNPQGGYHISAYASEIVQRDGFYGSIVTLNGFPNGPTGKPLLTMPTSCGGPLTFTATSESWQGEQSIQPFSPLDGEGRPLSVTGCNRLDFNPELRVQPSTRRADSPSGLDVELSVPQEESTGGLAQADLKEALITLPPGFRVSPSAAAGLGACPLLRGTESTKEREESQRKTVGINLETSEPVNCPTSSKLGSVEIVSPLLGPERPLQGAIYLAAPQNFASPQNPTENPFRSLVSLYLVAEVANVVLKIPGEVSLDPTTGQLTTRFGEDPINNDYLPEFPFTLPEFPFTHLRVNLFGGPYAPLSTPDQCGTYTVTSQLTPWSAPESGPPATPSSSFAIDEGCHGPEFAPSFLAGTESNLAGSFSPFSTTLHREDGEGDLGRIQVKLPPGLLASVASVPLCGEPQAERGECPTASRIGHVSTGAGPGPDPFYVSGEVFLTGPYHGAPYGLTFEVPAIAGPFDLQEGRPVVVRAALAVDQHTAAAMVTTSPLPQIVQGVPLQVRTVNVTIDRPGFAFNPTSCAPMAIEGEAASTLGQHAPFSSRFQANGCAALAFQPKFTASTSGRTSRIGGASLDTKLSYPAGSQGSEANIAAVKVDLPKQLPSRLTTLRKACPAATFEANPAACPPASAIGIARVSTPVLPTELSGPVYFVSHGGEAWPNLVIVLQGNGIRVDLAGTTFISKAQVTSSTFKTVPDVPFNSFELYLPEGPYSALAAIGNLCSPLSNRSKLVMPITLTAQNGLEINRATPVVVTGCAKSTKAGAARHRRATKADAIHPLKRWHASTGASSRVAGRSRSGRAGRGGG